MPIIFDTNVNTPACVSTYVSIFEASFQSSCQNFDVKNHGGIKIVELIPPQSFFDALDDLNNGRLTDLDIALNEPPPNE